MIQRGLAVRGLGRFAIVVCVAIGLTRPAVADEHTRVFQRRAWGEASAPKGAKLAERGNPARKGDEGDTLRHELWGQTDYGEGYIYGPTNRRSGMTVVDIDRDGDNDFVFPGTGADPQVMLNLGSSSAFYPGGSKDLDISPLPAGVNFDLGLEFGDVDGDGLEDLVAILRQENPLRKYVAWFKNDGTPAGASLPKFTLRDTIYVSQRPDTWAGIWITLGDIDADMDLDLYVAEDYVDEAAPFHRIYFVQNSGTPEAAIWANPVQNDALTSLMPGPADVGKVNINETRDAEPLRQEVRYRNKGANFIYNLGDIHLADWDLDGRLDFMFYNASAGMMWIPNLGTPEAPAWSNSLGSGGVPRYDHRATDGVQFIEGTFNVLENPEASKPGAEWLRDVFLSVNNRLKTFRFFVEEQTYRVVQENPVAYPSGQGPAAFWDYDLDGDFDMFRMGVSGGAQTNLISLQNAGTSYNPAWGAFQSITSVPLNEGNEANSWRNDLYLFDDWTNSGFEPDFIVQGQDGRLTRYSAEPAVSASALPTFTLEEENFSDVVTPGHTNVQPRGFAMADFDQFEDGWSEIFAVYAHSEGANIVLVDTFLGDIFDVPGLLEAPEGGQLDPNRIEGVTVAYANGDSRPDLVITLSDFNGYRECEHWVYENLSIETFPFFELRPGFELTSPYNTDKFYARTTSFADIDADGDDDLFVSHRYPPNSGVNFGRYMRYYRNTADTGLSYVRYRSVTGQITPLTLRITPNGGGTQIVTPQYDVLWNNSGGALLPNARWVAGSNAPTVDILDTTDLREGYGFPGEVRAFVDVLPPVDEGESKAIIIVGDTQDGDLYPTFAALSSIAYLVLRSEGLSADDIRYFADTPIDGDRDNQNDVFAKPTLASVENAIRNWAPGADRVLVYLIDHGQRERFRLNGTEFLESSVLDSWLDDLQSKGGNTHVTTLIDTCESGSFVDNLKGSNRLTMTSSGIGPIEGVSLFDKSEGISFSLQFWIQLFNGKTYGQAFDEAKTSMEAINPLQKPQIDDDGDGVSNEGNDGLIANDLRPGANFKVRGPSVFVGEIAPSVALNSNSSTLWLADVVTPFPVEGAKAIIVPPNFERPNSNNNDEQPVSNLPTVLMSFNAAENRWQATYNGFTEGGLYQVQYFVKTGGQYYATPRIGFVDRINKPDAWEPDDSPTDAPWLTVNQVQGHNFHQGGDEDWVRFSSTAGTATFAVLAPRPQCQAVVQLYRASDIEQGNTTPLRTESADTPGEEVVFTQEFDGSDQYLLRVSNTDPAVFGQDTSYLLLGAVGTGGVFSTALFITALDADTGAAIPGASVNFSGGNAGLTSADGIVQVVVPDYGTFSVTVTKDGYQTESEQVSVNNSIEEAVIRLSAGENPPPGKQGGCAGCGPADKPGTWAGDALVALMMLATLVAASRRLRA